MSTQPPLPLDPIEEAARHWRAHGWHDAADGMAAVTSIMRAQAIVLARVEGVLRPFSLTFARYELLMLLSLTRTGALPMAKAGARLQVHPTSVTNAAARLETAGLVRRRPHPDDGRAVLVEITDAGRALAGTVTERLNREVFTRPGLPGDRLRTLVSVLTELRRDAGDFNATMSGPPEVDGKQESDADAEHERVSRADAEPVRVSRADAEPVRVSRADAEPVRVSRADAEAAAVSRVGAADPRLAALVSELDAFLVELYPEEVEAGLAPVPFDPAASHLLVEINGLPVACCAVRRLAEGVAELKRMYVSPACRGWGLAGRLLAEAERLATDLGYERMVLETGVRQPAAIGLYERAGYHRIPNYPPYQGWALSLCYAKSLASAPAPGSAG